MFGLCDLKGLFQRKLLHKALLQHCSWFFFPKWVRVECSRSSTLSGKNKENAHTSGSGLHNSTTCLRRIRPQVKSTLKAMTEEQVRQRYKVRAILVTWATQRSKISLAFHPTPRKSKYNIIKVIWKTSFYCSWQLTNMKEGYLLLGYFKNRTANKKQVY